MEEEESLLHRLVLYPSVNQLFLDCFTLRECMQWKRMQKQFFQLVCSQLERVTCTTRKEWKLVQSSCERREPNELYPAFRKIKQLHLQDIPLPAYVPSHWFPSLTHVTYRSALLPFQTLRLSEKIRLHSLSVEGIPVRVHLPCPEFLEQVTMDFRMALLLFGCGVYPSLRSLHVLGRVPDDRVWFSPSTFPHLRRLCIEWWTQPNAVLNLPCLEHLDVSGVPGARLTLVHSKGLVSLCLRQVHLVDAYDQSCSSCSSSSVSNYKPSWSFPELKQLTLQTTARIVEEWKTRIDTDVRNKSSSSFPKLTHLELLAQGHLPFPEFVWPWNALSTLHTLVCTFPMQVCRVESHPHLHTLEVAWVHTLVVQDLPRLEQLRHACPSSSSYTHDQHTCVFKRLPQLRALHLSPTQQGSFDVDWSRITHLHLPLLRICKDEQQQVAAEEEHSYFSPYQMCRALKTIWNHLHTLEWDGARIALAASEWACLLHALSSLSCLRSFQMVGFGLESIRTWSIPSTWHRLEQLTLDTCRLSSLRIADLPSLHTLEVYATSMSHLYLLALPRLHTWNTDVTSLQHILHIHKRHVAPHSRTIV